MYIYIFFNYYISVEKKVSSAYKVSTSGFVKC